MLFDSVIVNVVSFVMMRLVLFGGMFDGSRCVMLL